MTREILHERVELAPRSKVDRTNGRVEGVKPCGVKSANGRRYTERALNQLAKLYVDKPFNLEHAERPGGPRVFKSRGGWVESAEARLSKPINPETDGVFGALGVFMECEPCRMGQHEKRTHYPHQKERRGTSASHEASACPMCRNALRRRR